MKQTYIKPQMTVIAIDTESILAGSPSGHTFDIDGVGGSANAPSYMENLLLDDMESDF